MSACDERAFDTGRFFDAHGEQNESKRNSNTGGKEFGPPDPPSEEDEPQTVRLNDPVISARHLTKKIR